MRAAIGTSMTARTVGLTTLSGLTALTALAASTAHAQSAIVDQANAWEMNVRPEDNSYASPSKVETDATGAVKAAAVCGGYVALVVRAAFPTVTSTVLRSLTGSASPNSKQWNDAIEAGATFSNGAGTFRMVERFTVDQITGGDILAAEYASDGITGHTMIVDSLWLDRGNVATTIPGAPKANRWVVVVHDATSSPHGASDSRWQAENGGHDQGIGSGELYLFADPLTGAIVGWTWSVASSSIYQGTDPQAPRYRPMVAGALQGPGIPADLLTAGATANPAGVGQVVSAVKRLPASSRATTMTISTSR